MHDAPANDENPLCAAKIHFIMSASDNLFITGIENKGTSCQILSSSCSTKLYQKLNYKNRNVLLLTGKFDRIPDDDRIVNAARGEPRAVRRPRDVENVCSRGKSQTHANHFRDKSNSNPHGNIFD